MAANASINACMSYPLLTFRVFGNDASGLLFQNMDDAFSPTIYQGMHQHDRDSNDQTLYGCNQSCRNTTSHVFRITRTKHSDRLEGFDHTGNGTKQTQQGSHSSDNFKNR